MKNLLEPHNLEVLNKIKQIETITKSIENSYRTVDVYISDSEPRSRIKFNGNTRVYITLQGFELSGFGLRDHPRAKLSPVGGCGDEGILLCETLKEMVNMLAQYESIYPIK